MASLIYQVFTRYFLDRAAPWTEELALFLFTWIVLLAGSLGFREGFHVRLTVLLDLLPAVPRRWAERIIVLLVVVFGAVLAYSGVDYVNRTFGQVSAAVRYPIEALTLAGPVAGVLIVLHGLPQLFRPNLVSDNSVNEATEQ
ncbi:TRAP transporter small permease [Hwanghaeella sp.]|uniref:TRAP transporter small permease n=1 Tax=Hwanghaeella sp. TaxID=2605943 RepID=UPI003CCBC7E2